MQTQNKFRLIALALLLSLLLGVFIGRFGYPAYIEDVSEAWITQPFTEASYTIGQYNSSHYYAKNHTGYGTSANHGYEMLSTNASAIFEACDGNLTTGGTVFVKAGTYTLSPYVTVNNDDIDWIGEGDSTLIQTTTDIRMFYFSNVFRNRIAHMRLRGIGALGSYPNGILTLSYSYQCEVDHLWIEDSGANGIWLDNSDYNDIHDNYVDDANYHGIFLGDSSDRNHIHHNEVGDVYDTSIEVYVNSNYNEIDHNTIWDSGNGYAGRGDDFAIQSSSYNDIHNNIGIDATQNWMVIANEPIATPYDCVYNKIHDNIIQSPVFDGIDVASRNAKVSNYTEIYDNTFINCGNDGIELETLTGNGVHYTKVHGNVINGSGQYGIYLFGANNTHCYLNQIFNSVGGAIANTGSFNIIRDNAGFVTENSDMASNCINGTWISHGLANAPTSVTLTINGTHQYVNATCFLLTPTVIAQNATKFQIGFYIVNLGVPDVKFVGTVDQRDIYWDAYYEP